MRSAIVTVAALWLGVVGCQCAAPPSAGPHAPQSVSAPEPSYDLATASRAAAASNAFTLEMYAHIRPPSGNFMFSGASAETALAMVEAGARGETRAEMDHVLHVDSLAEPSASLGQLLRRLNSLDGKEGLQLHVADCLWGQKGTSFVADYLSLVERDYGAALATVDFVHAGLAAVATINRWAADETHGRIPEILGKALPVETSLVLANAIYFKGRWTSAFKVADTKGEAFHAPGETFEVPLMKRWAYVPYAHVDGVQIVELQYRGGPVMLVALPEKADGLADLEAHVGARYASWRNALKVTGAENVDLKLPRWRAEWGEDLVPPLLDMGMHRAFQDDADLTGMCASGSLVVSDVLQKTFVEVNEEGSEAAAVTVVVTANISAIEPMEPEVVFHADHPFLYAILDPATDAILFLGRVEDPRTSAAR